jgi:hypothetical protein
LHDVALWTGKSAIKADLNLLIPTLGRDQAAIFLKNLFKPKTDTLLIKPLQFDFDSYRSLSNIRWSGQV